MLSMRRVGSSCWLGREERDVSDGVSVWRRVGSLW